MFQEALMKNSQSASSVMFFELTAPITNESSSGGLSLSLSRLSLQVPYPAWETAHYCPRFLSLKRRPVLPGQTCPLGPSAPACPHSPPWKTYFQLVLQEKQRNEQTNNHEVITWSKAPEAAVIVSISNNYTYSPPTGAAQQQPQPKSKSTLCNLCCETNIHYCFCKLKHF